MSKPKKLASGNWNMRVYLYTDENGKQIIESVTRPTRAECEYAAAELKFTRKAPAKPSKKTVREAIQEYIALSELLSPTTLASYDVILKNAFVSIMDVPVEDLNDTAMQVAINAEAKRSTNKTHKPISAKTVKNEYGLLAAALKATCDKSFRVRLPSVQHKNELLPEPALIMQAIKGTKVELPCLLAMWCGMRMSEIRGLTFGAVHDGFIFVDRVLVEINGELILKDLAKTDASIRKISAPAQILELIGEQSKERIKSFDGDVLRLNDALIVEGTHSEIYGAFQRAVAPFGIKMRFHDLRHVFASTMLNVIGLPSKLVQLEGGWSSPSVMTKVYSQGISSAQVAAAQARDEYFSGLYEK